MYGRMMYIGTAASKSRSCRPPALEEHDVRVGVVGAEPVEEFYALALVVAPALMELLVRGAQELVEVCRHPIPRREVGEVIFERLGDVPRLRRRLLLEEDVAHMLPAVELVHGSHRRLLLLRHRAPLVITDLLFHLLGDHLGEDALGALGGVARVALQRAAAREPSQRDLLGVRARPRLPRVLPLEHLTPAVQEPTEPREALLLDGGGDGLGGDARRAVRAAQDDGLESRTLRRLDDDVRGDRRHLVLRGLVRAEHADGIRIGDLARGHALLHGAQ